MHSFHKLSAMRFRRLRCITSLNLSRKSRTLSCDPIVPCHAISSGESPTLARLCLISFTHLNMANLRRQVSKISTDSDTLALLGKKQVLKRRFGFWSLFAFAVCELITWETVLAIFAQGLNNGGPAGLIYGFIIAWMSTMYVILLAIKLISKVRLHLHLGARQHEPHRLRSILLGLHSCFGQVQKCAELRCGMAHIFGLDCNCCN
jgi:hypothetical protein